MNPGVPHHGRNLFFPSRILNMTVPIQECSYVQELTDQVSNLKIDQFRNDRMVLGLVDVLPPPGGSISFIMRLETGRFKDPLSQKPLLAPFEPGKIPGYQVAGHYPYSDVNKSGQERSEDDLAKSK